MTSFIAQTVRRRCAGGGTKRRTCASRAAIGSIAGSPARRTAPCVGHARQLARHAPRQKGEGNLALRPPSSSSNEFAPLVTINTSAKLTRCRSPSVRRSSPEFLHVRRGLLIRATEAGALPLYRRWCLRRTSVRFPPCTLFNGGSSPVLSGQDRAQTCRFDCGT
jgi:hypothetical protein